MEEEVGSFFWWKDTYSLRKISPSGEEADVPLACWWSDLTLCVYSMPHWKFVKLARCHKDRTKCWLLKLCSIIQSNGQKLICNKCTWEVLHPVGRQVKGLFLENCLATNLPHRQANGLWWICVKRITSALWEVTPMVSVILENSSSRGHKSYRWTSHQGRWWSRLSQVQRIFKCHQKFWQWSHTCLNVEPLPHRTLPDMTTSLGLITGFWKSNIL